MRRTVKAILGGGAVFGVLVSMLGLSALAAASPAVEAWRENTVSAARQASPGMQAYTQAARAGADAVAGIGPGQARRGRTGADAGDVMDPGMGIDPGTGVDARIGINPGTGADTGMCIDPGSGADGRIKIAPGTGGDSGTDTDALPASGIDIARLTAAQGASQVIVVVGSGMDSSSVQVTYFKKDGSGGWYEEFSVPGYCGHDGMAADKREGDRRTPVGTYSFDFAFGIKADPGSILPYKVLDDTDYWVDDSNSSHYNQMASTKDTAADWGSAEHLIGVTPQYNYSLVINYNTAERTPGKGSAIFLHGYHTWKTWTEGCIAIPEERMKQLLQSVDEDAKILVVPDASGLSYVD